MNIKVIITGGTIDKSYNMQNGQLHFVDSHVPAMLAEARCKATFELEKIMLKDSGDMTDDDRMQIFSCCEQAEQGKIIITHGTDAMVETAVFLADKALDKTFGALGSRPTQKPVAPRRTANA